MIVGFDHDDPSIFEVMPKFLAEARISAALGGMLYAIPTTPLYDRLRAECRLNDDEVRDGFIRVMQACYSADHYFQRLDAQFLDENFKFTLHELPYWKSHRWAWPPPASCNESSAAAG